MNIKRFGILAICLMAALTANAGVKADAIYKKYKDVENCTALTLSGPLMKLAMGSAAKQLPKGAKVSSINVIGFESEKFADPGSMWEKLDCDLRKSMEMLTDTRKDGNRVKIYVEPQGDIITSFVMFVQDSHKNVFAVLCNGSMPKDEVSKMIEENTKK